MVTTTDLVIGGVIVLAIGAGGFLAGKKLEGIGRDIGGALGFGENGDIATIRGAVKSTAAGVQNIKEISKSGQGIVSDAIIEVDKARNIDAKKLVQDELASDFNSVKEFFGGTANVFNNGTLTGPVKAGNSPATLGFFNQQLADVKQAARDLSDPITLVENELKSDFSTVKNFFFKPKPSFGSLLSPEDLGE